MNAAQIRTEFGTKVAANVNVAAFDVETRGSSNFRIRNTDILRTIYNYLQGKDKEKLIRISRVNNDGYECFFYVIACHPTDYKGKNFLDDVALLIPGTRNEGPIGKQCIRNLQFLQDTFNKGELESVLNNPSIICGDRAETFDAKFKQYHDEFISVVSSNLSTYISISGLYTKYSAVMSYMRAAFMAHESRELPVLSPGKSGNQKPVDA